MLGQFGYEYYQLGLVIGALEEWLGHEDRSVAYLDPRMSHAFEYFAKKKVFWADQELELIWQKIFKYGRTHWKFGWRGQTNSSSTFLKRIREIRGDLDAYTAKKSFYYLRSDLAAFYGQQELFGVKIRKAFKDAAEDIEHAGNCLALSENTACILHLMRAMEAAVRTLAKKLNVTINPKDTWGMILKNMDSGISALPETSAKQKRKKDHWSECRVNLFHVKNAWRDNSMHGKRTYTDTEARKVMESVKVFMDQLATL